MFGLGKDDISSLEEKYNSDREKLLAFLEADLRRVEEEKKELLQAFNALQDMPPNMLLDERHLRVIKSRLGMIHNYLLIADKLAGEEAAHVPPEMITLNELGEMVDKIFALNKKRR